MRPPQLTAAASSRAWLPVLATRPGRTLAHRLSFPSELALNVGVTLGGAFYVAFGTAISVGAVLAFTEGNRKFGIFLVLLAVLMLSAGRSALGIVLRAVRTALLAPPAVLEVSQAAVRPGEPFELRVEQPRAAGLSSLMVSLVCEELATRGGGKNARTKSHLVFEKLALSSQPRAEGVTGPLVRTARVTLPRGAMHSFEGRRNTIRWKIVVAATTLQGVEVRREAPLAVHPDKPKRAGGYRDPGHA